MKRALFLCLILFTSWNLPGQEADPRPESSSAISIYVGTLFYATPFSITYEHLWHREKSQLGISGGMPTTFMDGFQYNALGMYLAGILVTGKKNNHFELRLGASYHPIYLYPEAGAKNEDIPFMPVVAFGYRFQKPGDDRYYRVMLGTGGIGVGIGFVLNPNK